VSRNTYFYRKNNILSAISNRSNSQRYHVIELLKVGRCYFIRISNGNIDAVIRDQKVTGSKISLKKYKFERLFESHISLTKPVLQRGPKIYKSLIKWSTGQAGIWMRFVSGTNGGRQLQIRKNLNSPLVLSELILSTTFKESWESALIKP
jgi:hypothetical protein